MPRKHWEWELLVVAPDGDIVDCYHADTLAELLALDVQTSGDEIIYGVYPWIVHGEGDAHKLESVFLGPDGWRDYEGGFEEGYTLITDPDLPKYICAQAQQLEDQK